MKKLLALLLTLFLTLCCFTVYADEITYPIGGLCGDDMTWILTSDGVLTISGSGEMEYSATYSPWYDYRKLIKSVVFSGTPTSIHTYAFLNCSYLTKISLPDSITSIGQYGLAGCAFSSVVLPANLTYLGSRALYNCLNMTTVTIPASLLYINPNTFSASEGYSSKLETVNFTGTAAQCEALPVDATGNDTYISAVKVCSDETYNYFGTDSDWRWALTTEGVLTVTGTGTMNYGTSNTPPWYASAYRSKITSAVVSEGASNINMNAFISCTNLTSVSIPSTVTMIGASSFAGCRSLSSVTIPSGVTYISSKAFNNCAALTSVQYSGTNADWRNITIVSTDGGNNYLVLAKAKTWINLPASLTTLESEALSGTGSEGIVLPAACADVSSDAFNSCDELICIKKPSGTTVDAPQGVYVIDY